MPNIIGFLFFLVICGMGFYLWYLQNNPPLDKCPACPVCPSLVSPPLIIDAEKTNQSNNSMNDIFTGSYKVTSITGTITKGYTNKTTEIISSSVYTGFTDLKVNDIIQVKMDNDKNRIIFGGDERLLSTLKLLSSDRTSQYSFVGESNDNLTTTLMAKLKLNGSKNSDGSITINGITHQGYGMKPGDYGIETLTQVSDYTLLLTPHQTSSFTDNYKVTSITGTVKQGYINPVTKPLNNSVNIAGEDITINKVISLSNVFNGGKQSIRFLTNGYEIFVDAEITSDKTFVGDYTVSENNLYTRLTHTGTKNDNGTISIVGSYIIGTSSTDPNIEINDYTLILTPVTT